MDIEHRKCRKRLTFENQHESSTDSSVQEKDIDNTLPEDIINYFPENKSLLPVPRHFHQNIPENDSRTHLDLLSTLLTGNSVLSTPKSTLSCPDIISFIASPSEIFINKSIFSNVDEFFEHLEKQITESKNSSPEQNNHNVLRIQAQIDSPPSLSTQCPENFFSSKLSIETEENDIGVLQKPNHSCAIIPDISTQGVETKNKNCTHAPQEIQIGYAELIPIENQITIDIPENRDESSSIVVIETLVIDDNQNKIATVDNDTNNQKQKTAAVAEDIDQTENAPQDEYVDEVASAQPTTDDLETAIVNEPENNSDDHWQIFSLEKPDSSTRPSRKRKRDEENWKDNKNKKLKNSGKRYESVRTKEIREEKIMGAACSCKRKCYEKLDHLLRKKIFNHYWGLGDHEKQWEWILRHVTSNSIKKMQLERKCNRTQTIFYNLPIGTEDNYMKTVVCKKMFINTLGISEKVVYTAIEKQTSSVEDFRGKHLNRPRKIQEDTERSVIEHINEFPAIDSHYTRKRSAKVYLNENLNISKMYRYYKEWFSDKTEYSNCLMASKHQYEMIFNTQFNISFFKPKKDQCEPCSIYKNADEERKSQLQDEHEKHLSEKEKVRELKNHEKCVTDSNVKTVACFDLEKVLYVPQSDVSTFYYKRKFAIYNFTVYDLMMKKGYCYLWNQHVAKRGANEIGSCLWHYLNQEKNKGKTELSLYSDACTGQNRNRFIFAMYQLACKRLHISITHRFFVSGHSQSEGDMMHSCIERAKKNQTIYTPQQMYFIVENAKVEGKKFDVKEMTQAEFFDIKKLVQRKGQNWTSDTNGNKVYWSKIREVSVKADTDDTIFFKYGLDEPQHSIKTKLNKGTSSRRRRNVPDADAEVVSLQPAYSGPIPLPKPLHKDLLSLCDSEAIPKRYQLFFRGLTVQDQPQEQNDRSDDSSEEEQG